MMLDWLRRFLPHRCSPKAIIRFKDGSESHACEKAECKRKVDWDALPYPEDKYEEPTLIERNRD